MSACDDCLRRTDLIAAFGGRIELEWKARTARARLLALSDERLLDWGDDEGVRRRYAAFDPEAARERVARERVVGFCRCAPEYPRCLFDLPDPPAVIHTLGDPCLVGVEDAVSIVGARRASPYGLEVASTLARGLAAAGLLVVSGMALGIDSAAHAGALQAKRPTVAVLAGGAERPYPASKRLLHEQIARSGCVVSELPPGFRAFRWCFPARNRIIAALGAATVVVEAAERSGSLITADFAMEAGRLVCAVPGAITSRLSAGSNALLKSGAEVVLSPQDVLDGLFGAGARTLGEPTGVELPESLRCLLAAVEQGRGTLTALTPDPDDLPRVAAGLGELEIRGLIRRTPVGTWIRAA